MPVLSRFVQRERLERASELVNGDVLEFGCGEAKILEYAGQRINRYVGIDRSPRILDEAKQRYPDHTFMELDVEKDTPPFDAEFDIVLMLAFIEHIFNQRHLFEICCKSLRSSGRLIVTTPTPFGNAWCTVWARRSACSRNRRWMTISSSKIRAASELFDPQGFDLIYRLRSDRDGR